MRSAGGKLSSKIQKGHWSEEGGGDVGDEGGDRFMVLTSHTMRAKVNWLSTESSANDDLALQEIPRKIHSYC